MPLAEDLFSPTEAPLNRHDEATPVVEIRPVVDFRRSPVKAAKVVGDGGGMAMAAAARVPGGAAAAKASKLPVAMTDAVVAALADVRAQSTLTTEQLVAAGKRKRDMPDGNATRQVLYYANGRIRPHWNGVSKYEVRILKKDALDYRIQEFVVRTGCKYSDYPHSRWVALVKAEGW